MREQLKSLPPFSTIAERGENLTGGYRLLTPEVIAQLPDAEFMVAAQAISEVIAARYGNAYGDPDVYDPQALTRQMYRGSDRIPQKDGSWQVLHFWLAGTTDVPGFVTAVSVRADGTAKLVKSAKSPEDPFKDLRGGQIMAMRIPYILDKVPEAKYFWADCRAARVESVSIDAKSPYLLPSGIEARNSVFLNTGQRQVQDLSVVMMGVRNFQAIPAAALYARPGSLSWRLMQAVTNLMHAKWDRQIYSMSKSDAGDGGKICLAGEWNGCDRYFTLALDPTDPDSVTLQVSLEDFGFLPTRFWPPIGNNGTPSLHYGLLNRSVGEVFAMNLPGQLGGFPHSQELQAVFSTLSEIGKGLIGERQTIPDVF